PPAGGGVGAGGAPIAPSSATRNWTLHSPGCGSSPHRVKRRVRKIRVSEARSARFVRADDGDRTRDPRRGQVDARQPDEPARTGRSNAIRQTLSAGRRFASHLLTLIAVGAVVSGFLVPAFTRGAQNHKQGLDAS